MVYWENYRQRQMLGGWLTEQVKLTLNMTDDI